MTDIFFEEIMRVHSVLTVSVHGRAQLVWGMWCLMWLAVKDPGGFKKGSGWSGVMQLQCHATPKPVQPLQNGRAVPQLSGPDSGWDRT